MSKYIKLEDAKTAIREKFKSLEDRVEINDVLNNLPTIEVSEDAISREEVCRAIITCGEVDNDLTHLYDVIENFPSVIPSRAEGEWEEKETFHNADDNPIIEEWQSAKCSVCNKYHTTP